MTLLVHWCERCARLVEHRAARVVRVRHRRDVDPGVDVGWDATKCFMGTVAPDWVQAAFILGGHATLNPIKEQLRARLVQAADERDRAHD